MSKTDPIQSESEIESHEVWAARILREKMVVSPFQAKAALQQSGMLADVNALMDVADEITQLAWQNAQEFRRLSPMVSAIGYALDLDDGQIDELFKLAQSITA